MRFLALGSLLLFAAYVAVIAAADPVLVVRTSVAPADVIVVLGGDGPPRAKHAAAVFHAGLAPRLLISGAGDCDYIRRLMIDTGVPSEAIARECSSRSTVENAAFSAPILVAVGARSALLVTSSFHTRRALASFQKAMPQINWMSAPVERTEPLWRLVWDIAGREMAEEYLKVLYYAVYYDIRLNPELGETQ
jgi:uncharacterized SAM-binding protein YcdF (DUF218 family)